MPHLITRPCCNDASCVSVCPVNCIHPKDLPGSSSATDFVGWYNGHLTA
ncbi:hypothetical protein BPODLACK_00079 [Gordonia sp. YY1]|nr:hypothetical protein BPODLACK_00079 [Gordonia sp. YY1]